MNTQVGRVGKGGTLEVALDPGICGMLRAWSHRLCRANMEDPGNHLPRGPGASRGETRKAVGLWLPNSGDAQQERRVRAARKVLLHWGRRWNCADPVTQF